MGFWMVLTWAHLDGKFKSSFGQVVDSCSQSVGTLIPDDTSRNQMQDKRTCNLNATLHFSEQKQHKKEHTRKSHARFGLLLLRGVCCKTRNMLSTSKT